MKKLNGLSALFIVLLLFVGESGAQHFRQTLHIQVTNPPVTSNSITINGATRVWTNRFGPTFIYTNLTSKNAAKTNLFSQFSSWAWTTPEGFLNLVNEGTNSFKLVGPLDRNITALSVGNWAVLTLSTQLGPQTYTALWPIANIQESSNRLQQASDVVNALNNYATNAVNTNATALSNYLSKPLGAVSGYVLTSDGAGSHTWQMISGGSGASNAATVIGTNGTIVATVATQTLFYANNNLHVFGTNTSGKVSIGFGLKTNISFFANGSEFVIGSWGGVFGISNASSGRMSWYNNDSGDDGWLTPGMITANSAKFIDLGGLGNLLAIGDDNVLLRTNPSVVTAINTLAYSTNMINGSISYGAKTISSVAAGHNIVDIGTNSIAYLTGTPGAAWTLGGIIGDIRANRVCKIVNLTGYDCTIWNEDGLVPTAAQRILTMASYAGTNFTLTGNGSISFIYSSSSSRWLLDSDSADAAGDVIVNLLTYILPFLVVSNLTATNLSLASLGTNASPVAFLGTDAAGVVSETAVPVKNIVSLSTSNATSKPLTNSYTANVLTLPGLEAGANTTITANGSNWVIASSGGGGGDVTTAQLNTASNAVWGAKQAGTFLLTNFSAMGISNILAGPGIALGTNNGVLWITNTGVAGLTNSDAYTTFEIFGHLFVASNLWVTGSLYAPAFSVDTLYANTLVLTNVATNFAGIFVTNRVYAGKLSATNLTGTGLIPYTASDGALRNSALATVNFGIDGAGVFISSPSGNGNGYLQVGGTASIISGYRPGLIVTQAMTGAANDLAVFSITNTGSSVDTTLSRWMKDGTTQAAITRDGLFTINNIYATNDISALTFTDRSRSPDSVEEAYAIVDSVASTNGHVDHKKLHRSAWGTKGEGGKAVPDSTKRDLGMVISAQGLVIKDLMKRLDALEKKRDEDFESVP